MQWFISRVGLFNKTSDRSSIIRNFERSGLNFRLLILTIYQNCLKRRMSRPNNRFIICFNKIWLRGVVHYILSKFLVCLVQDFFPRESYPLWAFLWEISLLATTSLHLYYLYKTCKFVIFLSPLTLFYR